MELHLLIANSVCARLLIPLIFLLYFILTNTHEVHTIISFRTEDTEVPSSGSFIDNHTELTCTQTCLTLSTHELGFLRL